VEEEGLEGIEEEDEEGKGERKKWRIGCLTVVVESEGWIPSSEQNSEQD
jgi:hypothetical protein